jgi:hypothetical protein
MINQLYKQPYIWSSVFIEDKSLIAKPDKNHRQVFVWGQITDYKTKQYQ